MELHKQIDSINSKADLVQFICCLRTDFMEHHDEWENQTLGNFLEAMEAWLSATNHLEKTGKHTQVEIPSWSGIANMLYSAKIYE